MESFSSEDVLAYRYAHISYNMSSFQIIKLMNVIFKLQLPHDV